MNKLLHSYFFVLTVLVALLGSNILLAQQASVGYSEYSNFINRDTECNGAGQLKYDDGTFENGYGWNNTVTDGRYVMLFTPPSYPWNFTTFCFPLTRLAAGPSSLTFDIVVYDNSGAGGAPGNLVATIPGQVANNIPIWTTLAWYDFNIASVPPLSSGSYYIGAKWDASILSGLIGIGADQSATTPPRAGYSWANAGPWSPLIGSTSFPDYKAMGIRTFGAPAAGPGVASNPTPANNAQNLAITGIQLSWTNPAGATSNRVYFGTNPASLTQIHSGSLISSINAPSPLLYNTNYYWRVDEIDGTGTSTGAIWTFKTMWDPSIVIDYLIAYDSTLAACRTAKDSIVANLPVGIGFELFNRGGQSSTTVIPFAPYKTLIWLGEGTSVMSTVQKDAVKAYLTSGTPANKKKLIIFSEDIGYQFGRTGSTYLDLDFMNNFLGANYLLDRPASGANQGLIGVTVNPGQADSTVGSYPDVLGIFDPSFGAVLYKFRSIDDANAIGHKRPGFEVATFGVDIESLRPAIDSPPGSYVKRFLLGAINYVPVEFVSFTGTGSNGNVVLNWSTATETNNQGFEVERRTITGFQKVGFVEGAGTTTSTKSYSFIESGVPEGIQVYRLKQVDFDGTSSYSSEIEVEVVAPKVYSLEQNYPNPFNPSTKINFSVAVDSKVSMKVFDILGQEVAQLLNTNVAAGQHTVNFDASALNSGVYFYQIEASGIDGTNYTSVKKMMLTK